MVKKTKYFNYISYVQIIYLLMNILFCCFKNKLEENRNNIIYNSYQNNRNPFIDYPKLAEHIWGTEIGVSWNSEVLSTTKAHETSFHIYPNPIKNMIHSKGISKSTQVYIYDTLGRKVLETTINTKDNDIDVSGLSGMYLINIIYEGKKITKLAAIE